MERVKETILNLFDDLSRKYYWDKDTSSNIHYYNGWKSNSCWNYIYDANKVLMLA